MAHRKAIRRDRIKSVRVSVEEKAMLDDLAKISHTSKSEVLRDALRAYANKRSSDV